MRLWLWRFVVWAGENGILLKMRTGGIHRQFQPVGQKREYGLMRPSVKRCVWLGPPDCHRNQDDVLWTPSDALAAKRRDDMVRRIGPSGGTYRNSTMTAAADERGGTAPSVPDPHFLSQPTGWCRTSSRCDSLSHGRLVVSLHSSDLAASFSIRFAARGTMLVAGLDHGASQVIGIEKEKKYLAIAKRRITTG